jgi:hypothetical protein
MPGLDPGIHEGPEVRMFDDGATGYAWMTGSSPVMTIFKLHGRST